MPSLDTGYYLPEDPQKGTGSGLVSLYIIYNSSCPYNSLVTNVYCFQQGHKKYFIPLNYYMYVYYKCHISFISVYLPNN